LVCIPKSKIDIKYFTYCINSADIIGDTTAMIQLTTQNLGRVKVPCPDYTEQQQISTYLDNKCQSIDNLIKDKQESIATMKDYKKSLVYEYTTGRKRVGGYNRKGEK
jgi:type I restriction enzyme S subunit